MIDPSPELPDDMSIGADSPCVYSLLQWQRTDQAATANRTGGSLGI